jgi:hypothetical protein
VTTELLRRRQPRRQSRKSACYASRSFEEKLILSDSQDLLWNLLYASHSWPCSFWKVSDKRTLDNRDDRRCHVWQGDLPGSGKCSAPCKRATPLSNGRGDISVVFLMRSCSPTAIFRQQPPIREYKEPIRCFVISVFRVRGVCHPLGDNFFRISRNISIFMFHFNSKMVQPSKLMIETPMK